MSKLLAVAAREWQYMKGNRRLLLIMCFIPTLYLLMFGIMYSNHVIKNISTVVLDYNQTATSRMVIQAFRDSEKFDVLGWCRVRSNCRKCWITGKLWPLWYFPRTWIHK
nr:hypothetical protein [Desulforamulus aquiferis]